MARTTTLLALLVTVAAVIVCSSMSFRGLGSPATRTVTPTRPVAFALRPDTRLSNMALHRAPILRHQDRDVKAKGFLDNIFGGGAEASDRPKAQAMICIDCGYIYNKRRPTFDELPANYKCPQCGVGKNRFKVNKDSADYFNTLAKQKAENRRNVRGPSSKRAELIRKQQEMQREKDEGKKKGWF
eukprot:CAMPEP_0167789564 /NCGR_PEP_ID=MMETSP0111_2-20121227/10767_1 /TAXON_ID=91324 /ORGANISM="Lotharella globosa, Strain CCCM811" /LENGTH=184 /DNA_ID=CAMNT_0007681769 /DNA_START=36 /DNA_END=590 /DNA_ORIENTATION=+